MSGLEIVIVVGAGIWVAHKVSDHRRKKKEQKLIASGVHPSQHGTAQLVTPTTTQRGHRQQVPVEEEEPLPLYAPPEKEQMAREDAANNVHLPTYDETTKTREEGQQDTQPPAFNDAVVNNGEADTSRRGSAQADQGPQRTVRFDSNPNTSFTASQTPETKERPKKWKLWERTSSKKDAPTVQA